MNESGGYFGQGFEGKAAFMESGVRDGKGFGLNYFLAIEEDVDVHGTGGIAG